jgi:hypothetical protein
MRHVSVAFALVLAACAGISPPLVGTYSLSPEALDRSGAHDLHDAVRLLRPNWLHSCVSVYRNERYWGGSEALHEFGPGEPAAVKYIPRGHPRPGAGTTALTGCAAIQVLTGR